MLIFDVGGKPENRRKTLGARTRTNNKLNPLMTPGPGFEPGPHCAITTAASLLPMVSCCRGSSGLSYPCAFVSLYLTITKTTREVPFSCLLLYRGGGMG